MLECRACFKHCLHALISVHTRTALPTHLALKAGSSHSPHRWLHATSSLKQQGAAAAQRRPARPYPHDDIPFVPDKRSPPSLTPETHTVPELRHHIISDTYQQSPHRARVRKAQHAALTKNSQVRTAVHDPTDPESRAKKRTLARLSTELKYLRDPAKLAEHVNHTLHHSDYDKALALVRLSSRSIANVVSWNHLINWQMKHGRTNAALEVYNEMKKRAVKPDSYTYTLLLRGLASYAHYPHSLGRALSLYHAIDAPRSRVARTIMHTNAVLQVCARANDMESLWDIISKLPTSGPHAADHVTFTTLINSVRVGALINAPEGETAEETARRRETSILDGRRAWDIVVRRWRAGDVMIDESLVNAMGRLLLIGGRPRDWDDVLSLVQQSMNIPRLVPALGSAARANVPVPKIRAPNTPKDMRDDKLFAASPELESTPPTPPAADPSGSIDASISAAANFPPIHPTRRHPQIARHKAHVYAVPGNATLSLILESCLKTVAKGPAMDYWHLLTDPNGRHALRPDLDNFHMLLRTLRQSRSSHQALTLVREDIPAAGISPIPKTFRIAMGACARDKNNPNIVSVAGAMLDCARNMQHFEVSGVGARTLLAYLDATVDNMASPNEADKRGRDVASLGHALKKIEPFVSGLQAFLNFGLASNRTRDKTGDEVPATATASWDAITCREESARQSAAEEQEEEDDDGPDSSVDFADLEVLPGEKDTPRRLKKRGAAPQPPREGFSPTQLAAMKTDALAVLTRMQSAYDRTVSLSDQNAARASAAPGKPDAKQRGGASRDAARESKRQEARSAHADNVLPAWRREAFVARSAMLNSFVVRWQRRFGRQGAVRAQSGG